MTVNEEGNFVGICRECNLEKGGDIVTPSWYRCLNETQRAVLDRYMRYAGDFVKANTQNEDVLMYLKDITDKFSHS